MPVYAQMTAATPCSTGDAKIGVMSDTCEYTIELLDQSGKLIPATVAVSTWYGATTSGRQRDRRVSIRWPSGEVEAVEFSVYHAFAAAREQLEPRGLMPQCYGACPEVQVSGMAVEMGDGTIAYRLSDPRDGWGGPTVNIFDSAAPLSFGSRHRQRQVVCSVSPRCHRRIVACPSHDCPDTNRCRNVDPCLPINPPIQPRGLLTSRLSVNRLKHHVKLGA